MNNLMNEVKHKMSNEEALEIIKELDSDTTRWRNESPTPLSIALKIAIENLEQTIQWEKDLKQTYKKDNTSLKTFIPYAIGRIY